ncbi:MAG TPA: hypothetical protein VFU45_04440 [Gemmatimonadales bacterium]|nr:hypothetical protein [Gemmatimonadales bacterium]
MRRYLLAVAAAAALAGCRTYDSYDPLASQAGLLPADRYAAFGREQAEAIAIGRELGGQHGLSEAEQYKSVVAYAKAQPDVVSVIADSQAHILTVQFKSGWVVGVDPINDGKHGAETAIPGK